MLLLDLVLHDRTWFVNASGPRYNRAVPYDFERDIYTCHFCRRSMSSNDKDHHRCPAAVKGGKRAGTAAKARHAAKVRAEADAARLSSIAFRHTVLRETYGEIAETMGLTESKVSEITRRPAYRKIRDELVANQENRQKKVFDHVQGLLSDAEVLAAKRILDVLGLDPTDTKLTATIAKLSTDVVKMRGHEAPKKTETDVRVSLSPESIRLLQQASGEVEKIDAIDLDESDWSYAMSETQKRDDTKQIAPPEALTIPEAE